MARRKPAYRNFKYLSERRLQEENDKEASIEVYDKWQAVQKQLKKDNPNYVIPPVPPEIQEGYEICEMLNKAAKFRKNWIQEARRDRNPSEGPVPSVFELAKLRREQMKNGALLNPRPITDKMDAKTKLARRRELREQRNKFKEELLNGGEQLIGEKLDKLHPRQLNMLKKTIEKKFEKFLEDHKVEHMEKIAANPALANVPYEKPQFPAHWLEQLDEVTCRRQKLYGFIPGETNQDKFLEDDDEKEDDSESLASENSDDSPSSSQLNRDFKVNFKNLSERSLQEEKDKKACIEVYDNWQAVQKQLKNENPNHVIPPVPPEIQEGYEICDMLNKAGKFRKKWIQEARRDRDPSEGPVPSVFELAKLRREQMKNEALLKTRSITHKMDGKSNVVRRREIREQRNKFEEELLNGGEQLTGEKLDKLHPRQLSKLKNTIEKKFKKFLADHKVEHMEKIAANPALANVAYEKPQFPAHWLEQLDEVTRRRQRLYPGEINRCTFLEDYGGKGDYSASIASENSGDFPISSQLNRSITRAPVIKPLKSLLDMPTPTGFDQIGFGQRNRGFDQQNRGGFDQQNRGGFDQQNEGFNRQNGGGFNQSNSFDQQNRGGFDQQNRGGFDQQNRGGFDQQNRGGFNQQNRGFNQQNRGGFDQQNEGFNRRNGGGFNQANSFDQQNRERFDQQNRGGFDRQNIEFNQQNQGFRQQSRGFYQQNQGFGHNNGNQNFTQTRETCFDQQNIGPNQFNGEPSQQNQSFTQTRETRFDQKYYYEKPGYTNKPSSNIFNADHSRKRNYNPYKKEQEKFRQENEWKRKF